MIHRTALAALLAGAALTAGCQPAKPTGTGGVARLTVNPVAAGAQPPAAATPATDAARTAGEEFLRLAAADPKAAAARLPAGFKALFFSDDKLADWLGEQARGLTAVTIKSRHASPDGAEVSLRGTAERAGRPVAFALRLVRDANNGWQVSRFLVGDAVGTAALPEPAVADVAWPREAALDFLEAFLAAAPHDDFGLALAGMGDDLKASLGATDNARRQWLRPRRQGLGELTVTGSSSVSPDVAMFVGDFAGAQRRTKFVLKVMRGADAVWRVSGFDVTE